MKLLLDAHISGKKVAPRLRAAGHDVRAANEEPALDGVDDADLLAIAAEEGRILVTFDVKAFVPIVTAWGEASRQHA